jgi:holo-[acyl-carrier protein] synthase
MIIGIGTDLTVIARIEHLVARHGDRFLLRVFTPYEREECSRRQAGYAEALAARFAAKEAVMKALGTGYRQGVKFQEIEVFHHRSGKPDLRLSGVTAAYAAGLGVEGMFVSLTHDGGLALAVVVLESRPAEAVS